MDLRAIDMRTVMLYALGRFAFGVAALAAPAASGRLLAGEGGATPDAKAFLRGMGGREIGIGLGLLAAMRSRERMRNWLVAGLLADSGDIAGIAGAWTNMPRTKRWLGLSMAGGAAISGATLLATLPPGR
jgi:hypothetical protein